ncbi:hypothetical protein FNA67_04220 [Youhaiella tibetensis]|uniref:Uncharacterized protein n=1 Tax=Paradevosia tibetensis TaxID=1447062 RepID=A0A5B9DJW9_9HYPH|nr:hypothetical protein [Youhaiella tibetensis]QEE19427.1 hypothetical protein FNA67_04220 [Youhaiella tibetensis]
MAAKEVYSIFALTYPAIQKADLSNVPSLAHETVHYHMELLGRSPQEELASINRRLTAMCVSDLARGVRQSLEDAATHIDIVSELSPDKFREEIGDGPEDTMTEAIRAAVVARQEAIRRRAQGMSHPKLVQKVVSSLRAPLSWTPELASFQKLRNCLEHRGGIVGRQDVDETNTMSLRLPYLKVNVIGASGSVAPLEIGRELRESSSIEVEVAVRTTRFNLGETVDIEPVRVGEIAFACWVFAVDIVDKLVPAAAQSSKHKIYI